MTDKNSRPKAAKAAQNANKAQDASEAARLPEPEDFWLELGPPSPTTAPTPMMRPARTGTRPPTPSVLAGPAPSPAPAARASDGPPRKKFAKSA